MNDKIWRIIILVLAVIALIEASLLVQNAFSNKNRVTLLPLFQNLRKTVPETGRDGSIALESGQTVDQVINRSVAVVGLPITIEDVVRGIARLEDQKQLPMDLAKSLGPHIHQADQLRRDLLECQQEINQVQAQIRTLSIEVALKLSPEQRKDILAQRDEQAIGNMEAPYWDALIFALESNGAIPSGSK
jgi:hypothetical protein